MFKRFLERKYLIAILIILSILYICVVKYKELKETTKIFDIENTEEIYCSTDIRIANIEKHYMIIKPPEDLHELKLLVQKFNAENPIDMKMVDDEVRQIANITADEISERDVYLYFYRESRRLPRNWQPNEAYMNTDRIEHHRDDCIASIVYSDVDQHKRYSIMKKKKNGEAIERIRYIDDEVVEHKIEGTNQQ